MRSPRAVLAGIPLHVVHRGNRKGAVFFDDWDRWSYLSTLADCNERFGLELWAYCLMTNHVHLLVLPRERDSVARAIGNTHWMHAKYLNRRRGWSGHAWENRYYSTLLDERHLWCAVRYVELNPVRAGLVRRAELYPWSSARSHCGLESSPVLSPQRPFPGPMERWSEWLAQDAEDHASLPRLRENSRTGRPTGSEEFVAGLEAELGRPLTRRPRGRPQS